MENRQGFVHLLLISALAVVVLGGAVTVVASDNAKPGDVLYSVDRGAERAREMLTFSDEAKIDLKLEHADERLGELEELQEEEASTELMEEASEAYGESIRVAAEAVATAAQDGEGFEEARANLVAEATSIHLDVLANVLENAPEEAKDSIEKAMENSENGAERSLEALNGQLATDRQKDLREDIKASRERRGAPETVPAGNNGASEGAVPENVPRRGPAR